MNLFIDIGGTHTRYMLEDAKIVSVPTARPLFLIDTLLQKYPQVEKLCISFAGQVQKTTILSAPNIEEVQNVDLQKRYKEKKIYLENDLNCAALAHAKHFNEENVVALHIGTGMGSGIVSGGRLVRGAGNFAGEVGHIPFKKAPFVCGCKKDNCIELFSSGIALSKWSAHLGRNFQTLESLPKEQYEDFLTGVLHAAATLITLFNPKLLVLGGGVVENNPFLLEYIQAHIEKYAFAAALRGVGIVLSELENAPLEGTKLLEEL
jgi:glucokinase